MTEGPQARVVLVPRGTLPPIDAEPLPPEDGGTEALRSNAPGNVQPLTRGQAEVFEEQAARWAAQVEGLRREVDTLKATLLRERAQYQALVDTISTWNNLVATTIAQRYER